MHTIPGDPGMPQTTAYQTKDATGQCTVHVSWNLPTNNITEAVSHFTVYIDGLETINITNTNDTLLSTYYPVCSCDDYNISVTAVDQCGREGQSSAIFVPASDFKVLGHNSVCIDNSTGSENAATMNSCKLKFWYFGMLLILPWFF